MEEMPTQPKAIATSEAEPETKVVEEPKISSTTELEKAYIADVNKESVQAEPSTDKKPELSD